MSAQAAAAANPWAAEIPEASCIPADLPQAGLVVELVDGDTIKVLMDDDGRVYSIRYLGVEAPALGAGSAGLGQQGMALNTQLTYRKQALMVRDITDSDASGTLLRYVLADGIFVNHALIRAGLGQVRMDAPDTACLEALLEAQQAAQAQALGLWGGLLTPTAAQ
jgi:endonuclease YncB( thermonuclease family)